MSLSDFLNNMNRETNDCKQLTAHIQSTARNIKRINERLVELKKVDSELELSLGIIELSLGIIDKRLKAVEERQNQSCWNRFKSVFSSRR